MESLFYRYRNITVLLVAICAQLILIAWQIKGDNDVPLLRVWAITAITPVASLIENTRNGTTGFFGSYFALRDARDQARKLRSETDRLRLENQLLKNALAEAQRTEALVGFQSRTPSRLVGARVIGTTTGAGTKSLLIDKGTQAGIRKGMAVVTPAGIVGRILAVYPFASQVLTVADPGFAAGVESQKNHVRGILRGLGNGRARVDYVPGSQKLEAAELFYTSGEDRVFPKGLLAARLISSKESPTYLEIFVQPLGNEAAPEEVLVIVDPVHQEIPEAAAADTPVFLGPDAPPPTGAEGDAATGVVNPAGGRSGQTTQADQMFEQYKKIGEAQNFKYGEGGPGSAPPNFNIKLAPVVGGTTGATGTTGVAGPSGRVSAAPAAGAPGLAKPLVRPPAGVVGTTGSTGNAGVAGPSGRVGTAPAPGAPGVVKPVVRPPAGLVGTTGSTGNAAVTGPANRFNTGPSGSTGSTGTAKLVVRPSAGATGSADTPRPPAPKPTTPPPTSAIVPPVPKP